MLLVLALVACAPARGVGSGAGSEATSSPTSDATLQPLPPYAKPPVPAGYTPSIGPGLWRLQSIAKDDRTLTIRVATSGCLNFDHATVEYATDSIKLTAWNEVWTPGEGYGCTLPLYLHEYRVRLAEDVRGRTVLGECKAGDATPAERQCASLRSAVASSG